MTGRFRALALPSLAVAAFVLLCILPCARTDAGVVLTDVTAETGITFEHTDGSGGELYVIEPMTGGLALLDYDGDGDKDIYFVNGAPLKGTKVDTPPTNALYRNDGNFRFTDVTAPSGTGDTGFALGVTAGDYDNDGDPDIYINNYGTNVLYRNNGDGTFSDVTVRAGVANGYKVGAGTCFLDMDKDGDLDLYVISYIDFSYDKHAFTTEAGYKIYLGPPYFKPIEDNLYRNNGNGTFTDVSDEAGISGHLGTGMGMICADYDNDGDTDIFVANDISAGNFLFKNDGTGKFEEIGLLAGVAYDGQGVELGSMGVDCADYDNDGWLDFYQTSYNEQMAVLYRNMNGVMFEDVTIVTGAGAGTFVPVTWGIGSVDFDNDGDRDIFVACGHLQDMVEHYDNTETYFQENVLLMNTGGGKFTNISADSGDGMKVKFSSRGAAFNDLDNDGDVDAVILNSRCGPTILRNDSNNSNHWLEIVLCGVRTNRNGVGARVKVVAGDLTQIDEVHSGRGYQSHYGMRLHFGLGRRDRVDRVEVSWIGGETEVFEEIDADKIITLTEGASHKKGK